MSTPWSNWSGSVSAQPSERYAPKTEAELATIVARAKKLRVAGAGHSFTPLCETDGVLLQLGELEGKLEIAPDRKTAWVPAGYRLHALTPWLWEQGCSLPNQGDIDRQALAGAIATGTHGTGAELGSLSTWARAFRVMLADGNVVECSAAERGDLFEAMRLSLGLIGIALRIQIDVLPRYRLEENIRAMRWAELNERFAELAAQHRHVEFWAFPYSERVILKTLDLSDDPRPYKEPAAFDEKAFKLACDLTAARPTWTRTVQRVLMALVLPSRRFGEAHRIFPSQRNVRFEEMEYELPRTAGLPVLREAIDWVRRQQLPLAFPFEFRWSAGDDIWLSPFNRGPSASVSIHQYTKLRWQEPFAAAEPIFRGAGGRPHWAKRHTLSARDVFELYPAAARFCKVRAQVDPGAKLANAHLSALFDLD